MLSTVDAYTQFENKYKNHEFAELHALKYDRMHGHPDSPRAEKKFLIYLRRRELLERVTEYRIKAIVINTQSNDRFFVRFFCRVLFFRGDTLRTAIRAIGAEPYYRIPVELEEEVQKILSLKLHEIIAYHFVSVMVSTVHDQEIRERYEKEPSKNIWWNTMSRRYRLPFAASKGETIIY